MKFQGIGLLLACIVMHIVSLSGQSPANLLSDISASHGFSTVGDIEATYNNARRQEEIQLSLGTNVITNLDLPSQAVWNSYTEDKQALIILNDERLSRAGIVYSTGLVKGYPFEGVAQKVDQVAQSYAQTLMDNDAFTHTFGGGSPSGRIASSVGSNCMESISRSENLYGAVSTANSGFPNVVAQAMYGFIYDDAGSNWGHREMCLLQDKDLSGRNRGFTDNHGNSQEEGLIGIGIVRGNNWSAFGANWPYGVVLVLNYFDPVSSGCTYMITESTSGQSGGDDCPDLLSFADESINGLHKSTTRITISNGTVINGPTVFSAPIVDINGTIEVAAGNCLEFSNEGCQYAGDIDCDPPGNGSTSAGTCSNPHDMVCGDVIQGNTNQNSNTWSTYGNSSGWTGPEVVFRMVQPAGNVITLKLDQLQADLDLILIQPCTNVPLFSSVNSGTANESISINAASNTRTWHAVVDGYNNANSSYRMSVTCTSNAVDESVNVKLKSLSGISKKKEEFLAKVGEPYMEEK